MLEIVWPEDLEPRRQLLQRELERMVEVLRQMPAVKKVIAFGSSLTGDIHETSDIDLIVVMETQERFIDRIGTMLQTLDPGVATDVLVYTPQEFEEMLGWSDFVQTAVETGKVVYDAGSETVRSTLADSGTPPDAYDSADAKQAIDTAGQVLRFAEQTIRRLLGE